MISAQTCHLKSGVPKRMPLLFLAVERRQVAEIWKDIVDYEGIYEISDLGNIRRKDTQKLLKPDGRKYPTVDLSKNGEHHRQAVHRLVALHFVPNPKPSIKIEVNHKDGNSSNNVASNLEWVSLQENLEHSWHSLGRGKPPRPVEKIDLETGQILQCYRSVSEAGCDMGSLSARSAITNCCRGKIQKAYGYGWRYAQ